jgi:glycosyltransferase involved in cell wall biosynthesis
MMTDRTSSPAPDSLAGRATPRLIVVMPAYNAARTLEKTYGDLPRALIYEIILVDDASQDDTVEVAQRLSLRCIVHSQNTGYGGNQKTCYVEALRDGADIVVMLHADNQYDATRIPDMIEPIAAGRADMVLGSRLFDGPAAALAGGMLFWKLVANRFLTVVENGPSGLTYLSCTQGTVLIARASCGRFRTNSILTTSSLTRRSSRR